MSVSIFSYRGEVTVGLMVDAALVPDPGQVVAQLELELEALAHLAPRSLPTAARRRSLKRGRVVANPQLRGAVRRVRPVS